MLRALLGQVRYGGGREGPCAHDDEKGIRMSKKMDVSNQLSSDMAERR